MDHNVHESNDLSSSCLPALTGVSSSWPQLDRINPHCEALSTVYSAMFTLMLLKLLCSSFMFPLLCVNSYYGMVQGMMRGTKTESQYLEKALWWVASFSSKYAYFFLNLYVYLYFHGLNIGLTNSYVIIKPYSMTTFAPLILFKRYKYCIII